VEVAVAEPKQPVERMVVCYFIVSDDVERSRRFYTDVLGGRVVFGPEPTNIALANSFIVINGGGGPTDDKPTVTLETPGDPDRVSSFLNIRVTDIHAAYEIPTVTSSRSGKPPTHRETGGPPTGHRSTRAGNPTEPVLRPGERWSPPPDVPC
jgi:catechol 2,3-dioxygenase-like lactoylglutathione lyase family enzyme